MEYQRENWEREWETRLRAVEDLHGDIVRVMAIALANHGTARMATAEGDVQARIIRFRWGAAVLEIVGPGAESQSRISQAQASDASVLAPYLVNFIAQLPPEAEPFAPKPD
jgi:hypothetical protein